MNKLLVLFSVLFMSIACTDAQETKTSETTQSSEIINEVIDAEQFQKIRTSQKVVLIDVRTADEFNAGHIKGAMNIDFFSADFKERMNQLDKKVTTLIYCASGGRSGKTARMMKDQGFKVVYDLKGGYNSWPF